LKVGNIVGFGRPMMKRFWRTLFIVVLAVAVLLLAVQIIVIGYFSR